MCKVGLLSKLSRPTLPSPYSLRSTGDLLSEGETATAVMIGGTPGNGSKTAITKNRNTQEQHLHTGLVHARREKDD